MILEAEKHGTGGLANNIVRYNIAVLPWNVLDVGQDGVPFLYDPREKRLNSATHGVAEKKETDGAHTHLSRVDDDGGGASTPDFLRDRLSDNRFMRGLASGRGIQW